MGRSGKSTEFINRNQEILLSCMNVDLSDICFLELNISSREMGCDFWNLASESE